MADDTSGLDNGDDGSSDGGPGAIVNVRKWDVVQDSGGLEMEYGRRIGLATHTTSLRSKSTLPCLIVCSMASLSSAVAVAALGYYSR